MSLLKYKHPFIDGLSELPENRKKELTKLKTWLSSQAHLPEFSDEYLYMFLHSRYYNVDKTKHCIEAYCTVRANAVEIFANRDPLTPTLQTLLNMANLIKLPKKTPEGYTVMMYSIKDPDPSKFVFNEAVKGFCMYMDCVLSECGLVDGYIAVFDMAQVCPGHVARVYLPVLKAFMIYIQEGYPGRLRELHILNTPSWVQHIMRIALPLVKAEYLGIVRFHKGSYPVGIPMEILPLDYGGEAPSVSELDRETKSLAYKYTEWLKESIYFQADETKRVKKTSWWGLITGSNSTVHEKIDEKTFLKNLQID